MSVESQLDEILQWKETIDGYVSLSSDDREFLDDCEQFLYEIGNLTLEQEMRVESLYEEYFKDIEESI